MRTKTIIKYEIRHVLLFLVLAIVASLACVMRLINTVSSSIQNVNSFNFSRSECGNVVAYHITNYQQKIMPFIFLGLVLMVIAQFSYTKRANTSEFVKSLPVKSGKWFTIRYLVGVVTITVPVIIATVGGFVIRAVYYNKIAEENALSDLFKIIKQNDKWYVILISMMLFWLLMITLYSALVLFQVLVNRCVIAGVIGAIGVAAPYCICRSIIAFQVNNMGQDYSDISTPLVVITQWFSSFWSGAQSFLYLANDRGGRMVFFVVFGSILFRLVLWIICIAILFVVAYSLTKNQEMAQKGDVFYSRLVEKIFAVCLSICCVFCTNVLCFSSSTVFAVVASITVGVLVGVLMWRIFAYLHK